jgi:hypothetical protein
LPHTAAKAALIFFNASLYRSYIPRYAEHKRNALGDGKRNGVFVEKSFFVDKHTVLWITLWISWD